MTHDEMTRQVDAELAHIPDWPGEHQNELRMTYNMVRRRSLGAKAETKQSAKEVLDYCIASVRERHPNAELNYDKPFFEGEPQK
jgi:hypothetical protein